MIPTDITTIIYGVVAALIAGMSLYISKLKSDAKVAKIEKEVVVTQLNTAVRAVAVESAKVQLHKDVSRSIAESGTISKEVLTKVQEKIDGVKDGEVFKVSI